MARTTATFEHLDGDGASGCGACWSGERCLDDASELSLTEQRRRVQTQRVTVQLPTPVQLLYCTRLYQ